MPRPDHETNRDIADRATQERPNRGLERDMDTSLEVTDEGLGLSPRMPAGNAEVIAEEPDLTTTPHSLGRDDVGGVDLEPGLNDQEILTNPMAAVGSPDDLTDPAADGDEVWVPPTDPVITTSRHGETRVLGGFSPDSPREIFPMRSASDDGVGDEALADAVRLALNRDATTSDLDLQVTVENGIVYLHGTVPGLEDVDNAETVAGRVHGTVEVEEALQVRDL